MKFVVVGPTHPFRGGIAHYTTSLVHQLRQDHAVRFFSFSRQYPAWLFPGNASADPSAAAFEEPSERTIDAMNPLTWIRTARAIVRERPDVLIMQWWNPFWLPLSLVLARTASKAGIPVLFICHHIIEPDSYIRDWTLTTLALRYADGFIVMTEEEFGILRRVYPFKQVRAAMHPVYDCFPPAATSAAAARDRFGLDPNRPTLLFFGFVRRYKGLRFLIEALAQAPEEIQLLVAGEFWEDEQAYRDLVAQLGLEQRVRLENRYIRNEEVEPYFAAADAVVLPYTAASQSGVGMMALYYGVPVIATDVGGLADTIHHGETGLIVPPGDSDALARAIREFFAEGRCEAFRAHIAEQRERLSWGALARTIEAISREIQKPAGGSPA